MMVAAQRLLLATAAATAAVRMPAHGDGVGRRLQFAPPVTVSTCPGTHQKVHDGKNITVYASCSSDDVYGFDRTGQNLVAGPNGSLSTSTDGGARCVPAACRALQVPCPD